MKNIPLKKNYAKSDEKHKISLIEIPSFFHPPKKLRNPSAFRETWTPLGMENYTKQKGEMKIQKSKKGKANKT